MVSCVVVFGTGVYARALSSRLESCGITCLLGSHHKHDTKPAKIGTSIIFPYSVAISHGISLLSSPTSPLIVILAIPAAAHASILDIFQQLAHDIAPRQLILVDISNPTRPTTTRASRKHDKSKAAATSQPLNQVGSDLHTTLLIPDRDSGSNHVSTILSRCQTSCEARSRCGDEEHTCLMDIEDIKTGYTPKVPLNHDLSFSEQLQLQLPLCHVVKAFNTISAYAMSQPIGTHGDDRVLICGDSHDAKKHVSEMVSTMGMIPIHAGRLVMARQLETRAMQLFQQWYGGTCISVVWLVCAIGYVVLRDFVVEPVTSGQRDKDWYDLFLLKWNIIIAWHSILCFTTVYAVGLIAAIFQLCRGTIRQIFPRWLDVGLRARKSLGIYGLFSALIHLIAALCTNPLFINFAYIQSYDGNLYQVSLLLGMLALLLFGALGVTSLPGVSVTLSWREWMFVQSKMGYVAFTLATGHIILIAISIDNVFHRTFASWQDYWLPVSALAAGGACTVLLVKIVLTFTPLASHLHRIRTSAAKS